MEHDHLPEFDLTNYIFHGGDKKTILDISDWIEANRLDEYLIKKIIDILWKTIM